MQSKKRKARLSEKQYQDGGKFPLLTDIACKGARYARPYIHRQLIREGGLVKTQREAR